MVLEPGKTGRGERGDAVSQRAGPRACGLMATGQFWGLWTEGLEPCPLEGAPVWRSRSCPGWMVWSSVGVRVSELGWPRGDQCLDTSDLFASSVGFGGPAARLPSLRASPPTPVQTTRGGWPGASHLQAPLPFPWLPSRSGSGGSGLQGTQSSTEAPRRTMFPAAPVLRLFPKHPHPRCSVFPSPRLALVSSHRPRFPQDVRVTSPASLKGQSNLGCVRGRGPLCSKDAHPWDPRVPELPHRAAPTHYGPPWGALLAPDTTRPAVGRGPEPPRSSYRAATQHSTMGPLRGPGTRAV